VQRCHWNANEIFVSLDQLPRSTVRIEPSMNVPRILGGDVFVGGSPEMTAVGAEVAEAEPAEFVAVTTTRIVRPTSRRTSL
jgi:hypothetical protein